MIKRGPVCIGHKHRGGAAVNYFAGLDVSLEETAVCIVDDAGTIVREVRVASEPEALVALFSSCAMKMARVGLGACSLTAWLHAGLTEAGILAICIESRQAKAAMGAMPNKKELVGDFKNAGRELRPKGKQNRSTCMTFVSLNWAGRSRTRS
jgi:transposase